MSRPTGPSRWEFPPGFTEQDIDQISRWSDPADETWLRVWRATCKVVTPVGSSGSGFFVEDARYAITNAHVVDGFDDVEIQIKTYQRGPLMHCSPARVVALDYAHDLAILRTTDFADVLPDFRPVSLQPYFEFTGLLGGDSLPIGPGLEVLFCGYPLGAPTPRIMRATISGYDSVEVNDLRITGPVLGASINPGNSGGPVCNLNGNVVGVIFAAPRPMIALNGSFVAVHGASSGIGYALDVRHLWQLLSLRGRLAHQEEHAISHEVPTQVLLDKNDFVGLNLECRRLKLPALGPFSTDGRLLWHGKSNDKGRQQLPSDGLEGLLPLISPRGTPRNFQLRGRDVMRWESQGYVVAVRIGFR